MFQHRRKELVRPNIKHKGNRCGISGENCHIKSFCTKIRWIPRPNKKEFPKNIPLYGYTEIGSYGMMIAPFSDLYITLGTSSKMIHLGYTPKLTI